MYIIFVNIIISIATYFIIDIFYRTNDKQYYRCSVKTHWFGILFPIINILFLNIIYFNSSLKLYILLISILCLYCRMGCFFFTYIINLINRLVTICKKREEGVFLNGNWSQYRLNVSWKVRIFGSIGKVFFSNFNFQCFLFKVGLVCRHFLLPGHWSGFCAILCRTGLAFSSFSFRWWHGNSRWMVSPTDRRSKYKNNIHSFVLRHVFFWGICILPSSFSFRARALYSI